MRQLSTASCTLGSHKIWAARKVCCQLVAYLRLQFVVQLRQELLNGHA